MKLGKKEIKITEDISILVHLQNILAMSLLK